MHGHDGHRLVRKLGERAGASPGEAIRPDQAARDERAFIGDMLLGIGMAVEVESCRRPEQPPAFGSRARSYAASASGAGAVATLARRRQLVVALSRSATGR